LLINDRESLADVPSNTPTLGDGAPTSLPSVVAGEQEETSSSACWSWIVEHKRVLALSIVTSVFSGVLTGLFSLGGTPLMVLCSYLQYPKADVRATSTLIFLLDMPARLGAAFYFGVFHLDDWLLYVLCVISGLIGGVLGHLVHRRVHSKHIHYALTVLILLAAISLLDIGGDSIFDWTLLAFYALLLISACTFLLVRFLSYPPDPSSSASRSSGKGNDEGFWGDDSERLYSTNKIGEGEDGVDVLEEIGSRQ